MIKIEMKRRLGVLKGKGYRERTVDYPLVPGNLFKWWQSQSEGNENRLSAITYTGKLINPQYNLPWISISDGRKGLPGDEPDLKTALLNLLKE